MTNPSCLKCQLERKACPKVRRYGRYYRTSDSSWVQRFRCSLCGETVSTSTFEINRYQKKRRKNKMVRLLLAGGMSQNRIARILHLNRKTVVRTMLIEALNSHYQDRVDNFKRGRAVKIQFDDLETFEHTKCKPLSITLAVEEKTRRILGFEVSAMSAKGKLAQKSREIYGMRKDERRRGRNRLFERISPLVESKATIKSDSNPHYPKSVSKHFPLARHVTYEGRRGSLGGQGELKKVKFDPLYSLNHTCAMLRANINRLFRKTWCTTKRSDRLFAHLAIYAHYHNSCLIPQPPAAVSTFKGTGFI